MRIGWIWLGWLLAGCSSSHGWVVQKNSTGHVEYDSVRAVYPAQNKVREIEVEVLKTQTGCVVTLLLHGRPLVPDAEGKAQVQLKLGEETLIDDIAVYAGGQRLKLSLRLQEALLRYLAAGGRAEIVLQGYHQTLTHQPTL